VQRKDRDAVRSEAATWRLVSDGKAAVGSESAAGTLRESCCRELALPACRIPVCRPADIAAEPALFQILVTRARENLGEASSILKSTNV
jgi:hypothetical protein